MRRAISTAAMAAVALMSFAAPASATVHEITGMFCAGEHGNRFPPGISGGSKADNLAKPLFATGFIESVTPHTGAFGSGVLISFDFDHPASKIAPHPTLATFWVGGGIYITAFVLDSEHGFMNCVRLRT